MTDSYQAALQRVRASALELAEALLAASAASQSPDLAGSLEAEHQARYTLQLALGHLGRAAKASPGACELFGLAANAGLGRA